MIKFVYKGNIVLILVLVFFSVHAQQGNYISLKQHTEILENRKKISSDVDIYFDKDKQIITKHYHSEPEFILTVNAFGEVKSYYPSTNQVDYKQISEMSSKRNLIYYFANNLTDQLGLADDGFQLLSSAYEDQFYVTKWKAPLTLKGIESVKMVFENGLPIYAEYLSNRQQSVKKTYYTNYKNFSQFRLPLKVIEINYTLTGDSIINRTIFSDINISQTADQQYFNFKIPENAKPHSPDQKK